MLRRYVVAVSPLSNKNMIRFFAFFHGSFSNVVAAMVNKEFPSRYVRYIYISLDSKAFLGGWGGNQMAALEHKAEG